MYGNHDPRRTSTPAEESCFSMGFSPNFQMSITFSILHAGTKSCKNQNMQMHIGTYNGAKQISQYSIPHMDYCL